MHHSPSRAKRQPGGTPPPVTPAQVKHTPAEPARAWVGAPARTSPATARRPGRHSPMVPGHGPCDRSHRSTVRVGRRRAFGASGPPGVGAQGVGPWAWGDLSWSGRLAPTLPHHSLPSGAMLRALIAGVIAGYGIAIPVGAIAVLIVETGMRCGFRCAAFAGAGAATADLLYAALATLGGVAIASAVEASATPFKFGSAAVLALLAFNGLRRAWVGRAIPDGEPAAPNRAELVRTYGKFLGLTIINPLTVVYFTVFVVGL
ncbi:MAG: hypothetical protein FJW79_12245, partial [Actinobacteria bacterium]|nr:hypothetical protein [Actinomycetota bacterium]